MKKILVFDTSILSHNNGDYIIMESVLKYLNEIFPDSHFIFSYTQDKVSSSTYELISKVDFSFIGGTNLLSSNMNLYNQWKINLKDSLFLKNLILMGVGWWQYQNDPNIYTKYLLNKVLSHQFIHSVRDAYTEDKLRKLGIKNVINTGCPTTWGLTKEHCISIPAYKSDNVLFTLTDYNRNIHDDKKLIEILINNYKKVYFWPQGFHDLNYLKSIDVVKNITILGSNLQSLDEILDDKSIDLDFIGTRLHCGIRALNKKRRSIIIGVDNRSSEISKDINLLVLPRYNIIDLQKLIHSKIETNLSINFPNINQWIIQFK